MLFLDGAAVFCEDTAFIWQIVGNVVKIIQWIIPILLILFGSIDLGKAVVAGEDKEIKEAQKLLVKRAIYAVVVLLIFVVVKALFGLVDQESTNSLCFECVRAPGGDTCETAAKASK